MNPPDLVMNPLNHWEKLIVYLGEPVGVWEGGSQITFLDHLR